MKTGDKILKCCHYFSSAPQVITILSRTVGCLLNLINIFWNFHFSPVSLTQDKTKKSHRRELLSKKAATLCLRDIFSDNCWKVFFCASVLLYTRVDRFCRFWECWYFAVIKSPGLICISGLRPTFVLTKSKSLEWFAILPGMDISLWKNAPSRKFRPRKILLIFHGFPWTSVWTQEWMFRLEFLVDTY